MTKMHEKQHRNQGVDYDTVTRIKRGDIYEKNIFKFQARVFWPPYYME